MSVERDRVIEDLRRQARAADREDKGLAELFEGMVLTKAWKAYMDLLNKRIEDLGATVLTPASSMDALIGLENEKGAMRGLIIARDLPSATIAAMKASRAPTEDDENE